MLTLPGIFNEKISNLLPQDGVLEYYYPFYNSFESQMYFKRLHTDVKWKVEEINMFGKVHPLPRLTAWYGDAGANYTYSRITMKANPWIPELSKIKTDIEKYTRHKFNSVLLNLYRDNTDHVSWHADDETKFGDNPTIASLTFGAVRKFQVKHKFAKELPIITLNLEPGSLVVMSGVIQKYWIHRVATTKVETGPRINLTFRNVQKDFQ